MIGWKMKHEIFLFVLICVAFLLCGCLEGITRTPDSLDALLDTVNTLATANVVSAPINPYYLPIGVGLSGLVGIIEALRRKEKSGRKHAEQELNGNNKT